MGCLDLAQWLRENPVGTPEVMDKAKRRWAQSGRSLKWGEAQSAWQQMQNRLMVLEETRSLVAKLETAGSVVKD